MPDATPFELRIYCLCGQKMKITSDMLGKPGKCIACRQKIRVPTEEEVGPDVVVIHLKDHPEYLRKPGRATPDSPAYSEESLSDLERDDVLLEADTGELNAIAFERFEVVRRLCNYEHAVRLQLQCIREGRPANLDKATLMGYRGLARQSRQQLEGTFRDALIEIAAELHDLREALDGEQSGLRAGDLDHVEYSKAVLPLRKRREVLVYRQQNLRGWLATEDPHMAGGLEEVELSDVPMDLTGTSFPLADEIEGMPIENSVSRLERALRDRERADKQLNELHRMGLDGVVSVDDLARRRGDTEAERERARTAVAFYRGRLEQIIQDCEEDSSALNAYESVMRKRLESAKIAGVGLKRMEEMICRAQIDVKRARNMASRALNANAVSDVPNARGTFLERLARPGALRGLGVDSWLAWASSVLLLLTIFAPVAMGVPGGVAATFKGVSLALFIVAALAGLSATFVSRMARGAALNTIWAVLTVGGMFWLGRHIAQGGHGSDLLGNGAWIGVRTQLLGGAWALLGAAASVSWFPMGRLRWLSFANVFGSVLVGGLVLSFFLMAIRPHPTLDVPAFQLNAETGTYAVRIPIGNTGNAPFWIGEPGNEVDGAATYLLEYKIGATSWADAGNPTNVSLAGKRVTYPAQRGLELVPASNVVFSYDLPPGIYRVQLRPDWDGALVLQKTFQVQPPDPAALGGKAPRKEPIKPTALPESSGVEIELRGVFDGKESLPIFSIIIREADGTERKEQFGLGDTIYGEWVISEFSPAHSTITVSDGTRLLIVARSKAETLN